MRFLLITVEIFVHIINSVGSSFKWNVTGETEKNTPPVHFTKKLNKIFSINRTMKQANPVLSSVTPTTRFNGQEKHMQVALQRNRAEKL